MGNTTFWLRLAAVAATGVGSAALVSPWDLGFLAWISFSPLLVALWSLEGKHAAWKGFGLGWLAGTVAHGLQLSWLSVVSPLGAGVLPAYLGLFWGVFGAFAATSGNPLHGRLQLHSNLVAAFSTAAVWASLEWLRGWLFTGFGWNGIGIGLHDNLIFSQPADLLGVPGLSLLLVFIQALLVLGIRRKNLSAAIPIIGTVLLAGAYGKFRIQQEESRPTTPLRALLVQNNIPQDAARYLWDPAEIHMAYEDATLEALEEAKAAETFPDWVIWPESALTGRILRTDDGGWGTWQENVDTLRNVREGGDFTLMFGAVELEATNDGDTLTPKPGGNTYNSLVAMSPADELQTFRKHHLVIFGETIPFVDSIPFLKKIYQQQAGVEYGGSFASGGSFEPLAATTAAGTEIGVIPSICFEDTVPRLTRRFLKDGPQVIVNITNDGWFKESPAAAQHFANAKFRAIELRRPMLRAANTGVTASVDTTGRAAVLTDSKGSHFTSGTLLARVPVPTRPGMSLYGMIGDWGIILMGVGGAALAFRSRRSKRGGAENTTVTL
ncbi:apolipoprotein N-acyltransferase [Luteolibacter sp. SL250]|uniref:apolipoprotein N-acyltransferase n=1 Tax=Luteolibacter sp. SL250 TaxID=2995170 RepID=UPI00227090FB|nr:apolipoprotein N-acyltransferase [Luteolibacter sp. SL250]WAC20371.1 apolipoprotein N-acyltransferase [Luteolibacter sp. SL250]